MKFLSNFPMRRLAIMLVLPAFVMFMTTGCDSDTVDTDPPVEDGTYMTGSATGGTSLSNKFTMQAGRVEGEGFSSNLRDGMVEGFGYLVAGELKVVVKAGATETTYGSAGDETTLSLNGENSQIVGDVRTGTIALDGAAVNIASAGFYHVILDSETMSYHYYKMGGMEFTNGFQALPMTSSSAAGASWRGTDIRVEGNFKFRWNEGWKIIVVDQPPWEDAYIIFSNFGKDGSNLIAGGTEWGLADLSGGAGMYTVEVDFVPGSGWELTYTRTGDIPAEDLSGESLEIIGLGVNSNGVNVGWDDGQQGHTPTQAGSLYMWTYTNLSFDDTQGFKFRTTGDWEGTFNIGCDFNNQDGPDSADVTCEGGAGSNLRGTVGSDYTLVVTIDGNDVATGKTLTVTKE